MKLKDKFKVRGEVEIFVSRDKPIFRLGKFLRAATPHSHAVYESCELDFSQTELISSQQLKNVIFNQGKDQVIVGLATGFTKAIARMAIGDQGAIPSNTTVPKVPLATNTGLYDEVYRDDVDVVTENIGTPTVHQVTLTKTFNSVDVPITAFSNQSSPVINEVMLVMADLLNGTPLPRAPDIAPYSPSNEPAADEEGFSQLCFKSIPFDAAQQLAITFNYTISIE